MKKKCKPLSKVLLVFSNPIEIIVSFINKSSIVNFPSITVLFENFKKSNVVPVDNDISFVNISTSPNVVDSNIPSLASTVPPIKTFSVTSNDPAVTPPVTLAVVVSISSN